MIEFTHTIGHPRTMMIHSLYTFLTDSTMMIPLLFDQIAFETVTDFVEGAYFLPAIRYGLQIGFISDFFGSP